VLVHVRVCGQGRTEPAKRYLECQKGSFSERNWAEQLKRVWIALCCGGLCGAARGCVGLCWCDGVNRCVKSEKRQDRHRKYFIMRKAQRADKNVGNVLLAERGT
jgi:hypothetical protein